MKYLLVTTVFLLMVSTGMSLDRAQFIAKWRELTPGMWAKLLLATFIVPPALALALGNLLPIGVAAMAGLYLVAVAPGAPLMTRNAAKHGFDLQMAASYQVCGALLAPLMIPLLVGGAGWLYGRKIWISPIQLLVLIAKQQFLPLLVGMALVHFAPQFSERVRRPLNVIGNLALTVALIAVLWRLRPTLATVSPWLALAALTLAVGCLGVTRLLLPSAHTLAISNVNRHVGLALLLSSAHFQNAQRALPAIAAPLVMALYAKGRRRPSRIGPPA